MDSSRSDSGPVRPIPLLSARRLSVPSTTATPESVLVDKARQGDLAAWSSLYQSGFDAVFRHVCYLTGDSALSEDVTQEAFARAFSTMEKFNGRSSFVTWVRGIALNLVRMHWRRSKTKDRVHGALEGMSHAVPFDDGDPMRQHQQDQRMRVLYEVLETLPEALREAFILRELEELSPQEAAEQLGISVGNVAVRATRARARIRSELVRRGWLSAGDA